MSLNTVLCHEKCMLTLKETQPKGSKAFEIHPYKIFVFDLAAEVIQLQICNQRQEDVTHWDVFIVNYWTLYDISPISGNAVSSASIHLSHSYSGHPPLYRSLSTVDTWSNRLGKQWVEALAVLIIKRDSQSLISTVVLLLPFNFYPGVGIIVSAWFKGLGTAHNLHKQYFAAKKMTDNEIAVFMEEREWDYRTFGFTAALLEGLPIVGLIFTISNRVGAAMWAHGKYLPFLVFSSYVPADLEKRQHFVAASRSHEAAKKY
ncbi:hypothetical protein C8R43DRAFT_1192782 [Mycena crocata]|nr:hypothetical protein C8R43DRAFT_1192782 [Mycena crocata]